MTFLELFNSYDPEEINRWINSANERDVKNALHGCRGDLNLFAALLSPAASRFIPEMVEISRTLTQKRFGKTMQMYLPLYLSNECQNICTYCGFSLHNKIPRITLSEPQILKEVEIIKALGYDQVLLVSGEAHKKVGVDYFERVIKLIRPYFSNISLEVQPLQRDEYERLSALGLYAVLVYQETYHQAAYAENHPKGRKSNFEFRLETPDRLGQANMHKIGLGVLYGLAPWQVDAWYLAAHLSYLEKNYWRTKYSISFPRLRPAKGVSSPKFTLSDRELVQLICAFRIFNEDVELSLSTREAPDFRDYLMQIGITTVSAGSSTEPGGYTKGGDNLEQFEVSDLRTPSEVAHAIALRGYEVVWKDWECFS